MRNITISSRLALGFGLIIILSLILSGIGIWRIANTLENNRVIEQRNVVKSLIQQWGRHVEANGERAIAVANIANANNQTAFQQRMSNTSARIEEIKDQLHTLIQHPDAIALYENTVTAQQTYVNARGNAIEQALTARGENTSAFFTQEMPLLIARYQAAIDNLYAFQEQYEQQLFAESAQDNRTGLIILGTTTALALLVAILLAWRVSRSITQPLSRAVELTALIAQRDLSQDIQPQGHDEVTKLEHALHEVAIGLQGAVGDVRSGADSIALAASQISAGNMDLSSRTEQQSSSLAQTAATMEEITATVRQNADNAEQANTLVESAAKTAAEGGNIVSELVATMGDINTRSEQVVEIISVIDSIAFQTNILALNAAVEAARAGEQGRGFAVVASEVRALAQRSAASAREIKTLIDSSVEATTKGNEQTARAGVVMKDIVSGINHVTDIMQEISAASREQTTGIEEINTAVAQMDDVTRQNASLVEESAAAATSLESQAQTLARLVATFKLVDQPADVMQSRPRRLPSGSQAPSRTAFSANTKPQLALSAAKSDSDWTEF